LLLDGYLLKSQVGLVELRPQGEDFVVLLELLEVVLLGAGVEVFFAGSELGSWTMPDP
jgi:hypothetical protein